MVTRTRLSRIEEMLKPHPPRIVSALVWQGRVREILWASGMNRRADMWAEELPPDVEQFESNPEEEAAALWLDTRSGQPHVDRIFGLREADVLPPPKCKGAACDCPLLPPGTEPIEERQNARGPNPTERPRKARRGSPRFSGRQANTPAADRRSAIAKVVGFA
jgi:hypothetical protein